MIHIKNINIECIRVSDKQIIDDDFQNSTNFAGIKSIFSFPKINRLEVYIENTLTYFQGELLKNKGSNNV